MLTTSLQYTWKPRSVVELILLVMFRNDCGCGNFLGLLKGSKLCTSRVGPYFSWIHLHGNYGCKSQWVYIARLPIGVIINLLSYYISGQPVI